MSRTYAAITILIATLLAACASDDGFNCDLDDATTLAEADWPVSRHDPRNTAFVKTAALTTEQPVARCIFPSVASDEPSGDGTVLDCEPGDSPITTSVIVTDRQQTPDDTEDDNFIDPTGGRLTIATQDGKVRQIELDGTPIEFEMAIDLPASRRTPLIGADGTIFVSDNSGVTRRFSDFDGEQLFNAALQDQIAIDPNIGPDGVIYTGTTGGLFTATCTNGAFRFSAALGAISVATAITQNPTDQEETLVLVASDSGRVTALEDEDGDVIWTFFTGGRLDRSGIVIDDRDGREQIFIIPDNQGQIFAAQVSNGQPVRSPRCLLSGDDCQQESDCTGGEGDTCSPALIPYRAARCVLSGEICKTANDCDLADFCASETITTAGALGEEHYYLATEGVRSNTGITVSAGSIYAFPLDFAGGGPAWTWTLPDAGSIRSSPIVLSQDGTEIVVFGADLECETCPRGAVYAVSEGEMLWEVELPDDAVGQSSPSVRHICNHPDDPEDTNCARDGDGAIDEPVDSSVVYIGTTTGKVFEIQ